MGDRHKRDRWCLCRQPKSTDLRHARLSCQPIPTNLFPFRATDLRKLFAELISCCVNRGFWSRHFPFSIAAVSAASSLAVGATNPVGMLFSFIGDMLCRSANPSMRTKGDPEI